MERNRRARPPSAGGSTVALVCALCVVELSVTGAGATVLSETGATPPYRGLVHATNSVSAGLEDLQLTVGEGPCLDVFESGGPVLVADLAVDGARWPTFTPGALALGAAAVFSFPLRIGAVRLGSLDLYRDVPGPLTRHEVGDALVLADLAVRGVVGELAGHTTTDLGWLLDAHVEVHQATGMVRVQLGVGADVALTRLRGHAFSHDLPLADVARQVVARTLRFTREEDGR